MSRREANFGRPLEITLDRMVKRLRKIGIEGSIEDRVLGPRRIQTSRQQEYDDDEQDLFG